MVTVVLFWGTGYYVSSHSENCAYMCDTIPQEGVSCVAPKLTMMMAKVGVQTVKSTESVFDWDWKSGLILVYPHNQPKPKADDDLSFSLFSLVFSSCPIIQVPIR